MAESIVQVTEGTGKKLHTWNRTIGANSVEDEYVLFGENALTTYMASIFASGATAASHFQLMAGASLKVRVRSIEVFQIGLATTAAVTYIELYRLSTAGTGGTAVTPRPLDTTDAASGATAMALPTVKGTESLQIALKSFIAIQTVGASTVMTGPSVVFNFDQPRTKPLIIAAGAANGIALKFLGNAGTTFQANILFDESSF